MLIGVVSDTHDRADRLRLAVRELRSHRIEALFHCGDIVSSDMVPILGKAYVVLGNNEEDPEEIRFRVRDAGGQFLGDGGIVRVGTKRIAITHGHLPAVKKRLLDEAPDYLLLGHSHQKDRWWVGETLCVNPGALHRAVPATCALLNLENGEIEFIEIP